MVAVQVVAVQVVAYSSVPALWKAQAPLKFMAATGDPPQAAEEVAASLQFTTRHHRFTFHTRFLYLNFESQTSLTGLKRSYVVIILAISGKCKIAFKLKKPST